MENVDHYRRQSDRLEELAEAIGSNHIRADLLNLAEKYDRLARRAEKNQKKLQ